MGKGFDGEYAIVERGRFVAGADDSRRSALDLSPEPEVDPLPPGTGHRLSLKGNNKGNRAEFLRATRKLPNCTNQHLKLLYLISLHARQALYRGEQEVWFSSQAGDCGQEVPPQEARTAAEAGRECTIATELSCHRTAQLRSAQMLSAVAESACH